MIYQRIVSRATARTSLYLALLTPVLAVAMLGVHFLASGMYLEIKKLHFYIITYLMISAAITCILGLVIERNKAVKASRIETEVIKNGYSDEFFAYCRRYVDKIKYMRKKVKAAACLSMYYADAQRFDEAVELMKGIELVHLKDKERCIYYITLSYVLFMSGDDDSATAVFASNPALMQRYLSKRKGKTHLGCAIRFLELLLNYEEGGIFTTTELIGVRAKSKKPELASVCSELAAIASLEEGELVQAKELAADACEHCMLYGAGLRIEKLMKLIEKCYGVESAE